MQIPEVMDTSQSEKAPFINKHNLSEEQVEALESVKTEEKGYVKARLPREFVRNAAITASAHSKDNIMLDALILLCEAVGFNIPIHDKWVVGKRFNCYIGSRRLIKILCAHNELECIARLNRLQELGFLKYESGPRYNAREKSYTTVYYIKFRKLTQYLCNNTSDETSKAYRDQRYNINNFHGYVWINRAETIKTFFNEKTPKDCHGIGDLLLLLYFNCIYNDTSVENELLRKHAIVSFGFTCGLSKKSVDDYDLKYRHNYYVREKDLATFMNTTVTALRNMLKYLEKYGVISTKFIPNKGKCVILRFMEPQEYRSVAEIQKTFRLLKEEIYSFKEPRQKLARGAESLSGLRLTCKAVGAYLTKLTENYKTQMAKLKRRSKERKIEYVWIEIESGSVPDMFNTAKNKVKSFANNLIPLKQSKGVDFAPQSHEMRGMQACAADGTLPYPSYHQPGVRAPLSDEEFDFLYGNKYGDGLPF